MNHFSFSMQKENMIYKKLLIISVIILTCFLSSDVYGKYIIEECKKVAILEIDRTKPELEIKYSTIDKTNENVIVTIIANEEIQEIEGWNISEDGKTLTKEYSENKQEEIVIKDISGNENNCKITIDNIEKESPKVTDIQVKNTNEGYENYANIDDTITLTIFIEDENTIISNISLEDIKILVGENEISNKTLDDIQYLENKIIVIIEIKNINQEGNLSLEIEEGKLEDILGNKNEKIKINVDVTIDNTPPVGSYSGIIQEDGNVLAKISADEELREMEGWNLSDNKQELSKEFPSDAQYERPIIDLAGNIALAKINVQNATYINLKYAVCNTNIGWKYELGMGDIAGAESVKANTLYKLESALFNFTSKISNDFLQAQSYVYTYWRSNYGVCKKTSLLFPFGYNPSQTEWASMLSENLAKINDVEYFQFGGEGVNEMYRTNNIGRAAIPLETSEQCHFGISEIRFKLSNYNEYSIIYQILTGWSGWLEPAINEEWAMEKFSKAISAIRIQIIPNSELQYIKEMWEKDIGTFNV